MISDSTIARQAYTLATGTDALSFDFYTLTDSHLTVWKTGDSVPLVLDTDYTVAGTGDEEGNVTVTMIGLAAADVITILRTPTKDQLLNLIFKGRIYEEPLEDALDKLTMIALALQEQIDRAIQYPPTETDSWIAELDAAADRIGKLIRFDETGAMGFTTELGDWEGEWVTATAYDQFDMFRVSSSASVYHALVAHTSTNIAADLSANRIAVIIDGSAILDFVGYAEEWSQKAEDSPVSVAAGGDGATEFSALHHSAKSAASATVAAASETAAGLSETSAGASADAATQSVIDAAAEVALASGHAQDASDSASDAAASAVEAANSALENAEKLSVDDANRTYQEKGGVSDMSNVQFFIDTDVSLTNYREGNSTFEYHPSNSAGDLTVVATENAVETDSTKVYTDTNTDGYTDSFSTLLLKKDSANPINSMLLSRFSDTELSGYTARAIGDILEIGRFDAGVFTILNTSPSFGTPPVGTYAVDFEVIGTSLTVTISGSVNAALSTTDSTYSTGRNGFRSSNSAGNYIAAFESSPLTDALVSTALRTTDFNAPNWYDDGVDLLTQNTGNSLTISFYGNHLGISTLSDVDVTGYLGVSFDDGVSFDVHKLAGGLQERTLYHKSDANYAKKTARIVLMGNNSITDNWTTPDNALQIRNVITSKYDSPTIAEGRSSDSIVVIGDSIARGRTYKAGNLNFGDATKSWGWLLGLELAKEVQFIAFSGQGASNLGVGNVPAAKTAINSYFNGVARPVDSNILTVLIAHGTNDDSFSEAVIKADQTTLWSNARTLYPNAKIYVILPLGYTGNDGVPDLITRRDEINGWISAAFTTWADGNSEEIDLTGNDYGDSITGALNGGSNEYTSDLIHPNELATQMIFRDILFAIRN